MGNRQSYRGQQRGSVLLKAPGLVVLGIAMGAAGGSTVFDMVTGGSSITGVGLSCNIKGNVSIDTGERIFHVPGQEYYSRTKISPQYGERWFCSEAEARAAGWRKSRR
ncbi:succinoglycan biosynthesis protein exoi [Sinorhizobium alkalisoli]|uniref:sunset domain-containing protein n=1 Tax=Sinorhizobium alkalisoli TaxID=1752398 RepID=UPI00124CDE74|nr:succinoglycan biosynthesis protein exoi [Sinorhizobium alkalisoli]